MSVPQNLTQTQDGVMIKYYYCDGGMLLSDKYFARIYLYDKDMRFVETVYVSPSEFEKLKRELNLKPLPERR